METEFGILTKTRLIPLIKSFSISSESVSTLYRSAAGRVQIVSGGDLINQTLKAADKVRVVIIPVPSFSAAINFIHRVAEGVQLACSGKTVNGMNSPKNTKKGMKKSINQKNQSLNTYLHSVSVIFQCVAAINQTFCGGNKNVTCIPDSLLSFSITNPVLLFIPNSPKTILESFRV